MDLCLEDHPPLAIEDADEARPGGDAIALHLRAHALQAREHVHAHAAGGYAWLEIAFN